MLTIRNLAKQRKRYKLKHDTNIRYLTGHLVIGLMTAFALKIGNVISITNEFAQNNAFIEGRNIMTCVCLHCKAPFAILVKSSNVLCIKH